MIKIIPLDDKHLESASNLVDRIFPDENASQMLVASLNPENNRDYLNKIGVNQLEYYIALKDNVVIGTSGLYTETTNEEGVVWLGWYCVDKYHRKMGYGQKILDDVIQKAITKGYTVMKIYSSAGNEGRAAAELYRTKSFRETNREDGYIYWEKSLQSV